MTGLQIALASGTLLGLALALLVWRLAPSDPDLVDALDRLSPDRVVPRRGTPGLDDAGTDPGAGGTEQPPASNAKGTSNGGPLAFTGNSPLALAVLSLALIILGIVVLGRQRRPAPARGAGRHRKA